jgi:NAD(P)-dependent dehydrogenase (short-subunit alcohol dehydrogenase family)
MNETAKASLAGKVAVVTGGSSGIGQYTALGLAQMGADVVITARDPSRLAQTAGWLRIQAPGVTVAAEPANFASFASVRALAARLIERHPRIDILVDNAGLVTTRRRETADGHEATFQINHLSPFLLTNLLLPSITAAAPSRIVVTASDASQPAKLDLADLDLRQGWSAMKAYGRSKLANILFTYALARRLEGAGVAVNCFHPGFVGSRIGNKGGVADLVWALIKPFVLTPAQGADTAVWAATAPEMASISGQYFCKRKPIRSNAQSYDEALGENLWRISAEMTGIPV